jgi:hypothetical protein
LFVKKFFTYICAHFVEIFEGSATPAKREKQKALKIAATAELKYVKSYMHIAGGEFME